MIDCSPGVGRIEELADVDELATAVIADGEHTLLSGEDTVEAAVVAISRNRFRLSEAVTTSCNV